MGRVREEVIPVGGELYGLDFQEQFAFTCPDRNKVLVFEWDGGMAIIRKSVFNNLPVYKKNLLYDKIINRQEGGALV